MSLNSDTKWMFLLVATSMMFASCSRVAAKTDTVSDEILVRAVRAITRDVPLEVTAVGNVEAVESVEVKSRVAGQVEKVAFKEGQDVAKGQLLFAIDQDALRRQTAALEAELVRDQSMEQEAHAIVARDTATQKQSQSEAETAEQLGKLGVLSGQRVDQLVTARDTASAGLSSDQAAVEAAVATRKADQARLAETQLQLNFANVVAPIAGRAGSAMVRAGAIVRDNDTALVTLMQVAPIYVTFSIPEQLLPQVQALNQHGSLTVEASHGDGQPPQRGPPRVHR